MFNFCVNEIDEVEKVGGMRIRLLIGSIYLNGIIIIVVVREIENN